MPYICKNKPSMSCLYSVHKCVSIQSSLKFVQTHIAASHSCKETLIASNNKLIQIRNDALQSFVDLDQRINAVSWSKDGCFAAVGDAAGCIHIISKTNFKVLYSQKVFSPAEHDEPVFQSLFFFPIVNCHYSICAASSTGKVLVFENLDLTTMQQEYGKVSQKVKWHHFETSCCHTEKLSSLTFCYSNIFETNFLSVGFGEQVLQLWSTCCNPVFCYQIAETHSFLPVQSVSKTMMQSLTNDSAFCGFTKIMQIHSSVFALCNSGLLYQFGFSPLILLKWWPGVYFEDFCIKMPLALTRKDGWRSSRVYGITQDTSLNGYKVSVHDLSTMKEVFSVSCEAKPFFVTSPKNFEDLYFIEPHIGESDGSNLVIKKLYETSPNARLLLLLQQHKYDNAENFAQEHGLDVQLVYQQKATYLVHELSTLTDDFKIRSTLHLFKENIAKISDVVFIGELCTSVFPSDLSAGFELLTVARDCQDSGGRSFRASVSNNSVDNLQLRLEIDRLLDLLVTFRMAFKNGDASMWERFRKIQLPVEVATLLSKGNLKAATVMCCRHENELLAYLEEDGEKRLRNLLKVVSEDADNDELVAWLEQIIPAILTSTIPYSVEVLTEWLYKRAVALEDTCHEQWPENGIMLANVFFKVQKRLSNIGFIREKLSSSYLVLQSKKEEVTKLKLLVSQLQLLRRLQIRYHCQITLEAFEKETTVTLTFHMLDKVAAPELVPKCLETTVRPYMKEHQLAEDETLLLYIKDQMSKSHQRSWSVFQSIKERKLTSVMKCLQNKQVKIEAVALLAKRASVPWSEDVHMLVQQALKDLEDEKEIHILKDEEEQECYKTWKDELLHCVYLERVPAITTKYGLGEFSQRDDATHKRLVRVLVDQTGVEALDDAIQVACTFSNRPKEFVYTQRINHLIRYDKVSECVEVLDQFPDISVNLVNHTMLRTVNFVNRTHRMWAEERMKHCIACINMIQHMLHHHQKTVSKVRGEWLEYLHMLKNIHSLQTRYGEFISVHDYRSRAFRDSMLAKNIVLHYTNKSSSSTSDSALIRNNITDCGDVSTAQLNQSKHICEVASSGDTKPDSCKYESFTSVLNVARLLQVSQDTMQVQIAFQAAKKCQGAAAVDICKDLCFLSPSSTIASKLQAIVLTLLGYLDSDSLQISTFMSDLHEIACAASSYCKPSELLNAVALSSFCHLVKDVQLTTDVSTQEILTKCMLDGPKAKRNNYDHAEWLSNWYNESNGLTLCSSDVFPIIAELAKSLFNEKGIFTSSTQPNMNSLKVLGKAAECLKRFVRKLKECQHATLAVRWVSKLQYATLAHLSNHRAFFTGSNEEKAILEMMTKTVKHTSAEIRDCMENLIEKVLLLSCADVSYAAGLLLALPSTNTYQLLSDLCENVRSDFSKLSAVARTGLEISGMLSMNKHIPYFQQLLMDAKWAQKLGSIKIPVDGVLFSSSEWKENFLLKLIKHVNISGIVLLEYCKDYEMDSNNALIRYASVLLGDNWDAHGGLANMGFPDQCMIQCPDLTHGALVPLKDNAHFVLGESQHGGLENKDVRSQDKIKEELKWVSCNVDDKQDLAAQLWRCLLNSMCPYDYDMAEFVMELIRSCSSVQEIVANISKGLKLISYLRHVKREQQVSDYEKQRLWRNDASKNVLTKPLPAAAQTRLPLHPLLFGDALQAWKILSVEANDHTVEHLTPITRLLKLSEDKLYMTAADNIMVKLTGAQTPSRLTDRQLAKVQSLTERISCYKMSVAMAKRISEVLPKGKEKVSALKWCISLASKWRDSVPEDSPDRGIITNAHQMLEWNYKYAATELALSEHGFESSEIQKLLSEPNNLIIHLYEHSSIILRFYEPGNSYPDIHALVDYLGYIHQIDCLKFRQSVILKLLLAANKPVSSEDGDNTTDIERLRTAALVNNDADNHDENNLIHLLYLLSHDNPVKQAKRLVKIIGDHRNQRISNRCRIRALHCLFHIVDDDEKLLELTEKTAQELRSDLRILIYLSELEAAGLKIPLQLMRQSDKSVVARSVLTSSRQHNPVALRVAAEMCREFVSTLPDTWIVLLQQLVSLQQVPYLQQLLPDICRIPTVRSLLCLASVWQSCVILPLVALTPPLDDKQKNVALSSYHFLLRCPVLLRLDLVTIAKHFSDVELHALALGCLLLSPAESENARTLAVSMRKQIQDELLEFERNRQTLLGHCMVSDFVRDVQ